MSNILRPMALLALVLALGACASAPPPPPAASYPVPPRHVDAKTTLENHY